MIINKLIVSAILLLSDEVKCSPYVLWYSTSAADGMNEALVIGNGRIGGMIYGKPGR